MKYVSFLKISVSLRRSPVWVRTISIISGIEAFVVGSFLGYRVGCCEAWTLTDDLKRRLDSFGTSSLRRVLGYRWTDFVSNDRLLEETSMDARPGR